MSYEFLSQENIAAYLASHPETASVIDHTAIAEMKEVGDGNLNLVFIVKDKNGNGIVLKQALPYVRLVGPSWPMAPDRARIEYETTVIHGKAADHLVPKLYHYDPDRYIIAMEDLSDHTVWRTKLNAGEQNHGAATSIGEYVAKTTFATSRPPGDQDYTPHTRTSGCCRRWYIPRRIGWPSCSLGRSRGAGAAPCLIPRRLR